MDNSSENKEVTFLPKKDLEYLRTKEFNFQEVVDGHVKGLIIKDYRLPEKKYQVNKMDLLIRIPNGYNDAPPDMFFCSPHLKFSDTNGDPPATSGRVNFNGILWQQWSRHSNTGNDWRPGIDGIKSHLQKVNKALEKG